ncbi:MAG: hypothetical protein AABY10_02310 [Nanoarchaeota archaeon]
MEKITLLIVLLGFITLVVIFNFYYVEIHEAEELNKYEANQKVIFKGKIIDVKKEFGENKIYLDNGINFSCSCFLDEEDKVVVHGIIREFNNLKRIEVVKIEIFRVEI